MKQKELILPRRRSVRWCVAAYLVVVTLLLSLGGWVFHCYKVRQIESRTLCVRFEGPKVYYPGALNHYSVTTSTVSGRWVPARVRYALVGRDGKDLFSRWEKSSGKLEFEFPFALEVQPGLRLQVWAVGPETAREVSQQLDLAQKHYRTSVSIDKPVYQPGETVFFRSLTLERFSLEPDREFHINYQFRDPRGSVVFQSQSPTFNGVGNGAFQIPKEAPGGEYVLVASCAGSEFLEGKRAFSMRHYTLPRLKKELEFDKKSYGPGDELSATFSASRVEGGPASGAKLTFDAVVDGKSLLRSVQSADGSGGAVLTFKLPGSMERGEGLLSVAIDDGGNIETTAKSIPITLNKLKVEFFPEGGDLVAGHINRVYFTARTPLGRPAHLEGRIVDHEGKTVARVETEHEGMGKFSFTPAPNDLGHKLQIVSPKDIKGEFLLPKAKLDGILLSISPGVIRDKENLKMSICSRGEQELILAVYCRDYLVGHSRLDAKRGWNNVSLNLAQQAGGVLRVTVYDAGMTPLAERLVYREPGRKLQINVIPNQRKYTPGSHVRALLRVTDELGKPIPATLGVSVVDGGVFALADDHSPSLPTRLWLTGEVKKPEDLEDADFYLENSERARAALDLLLGTQGWRRFVWRDPEAFVSQHGDDARHLLGITMGSEGRFVADNMMDLYGSSYDSDLRQYYRQVRHVIFIILLAVLVVAFLTLIVWDIHFRPESRPVGASLGILGILLSLGTIPHIMAREESRKMKCLSCLRQLGTGMVQYIDQFGKGRYYTWPGTEALSFNGSQWLISAYWISLLNEPDMYLCLSTVDDDEGRLGRKFTSLSPTDVAYAGLNRIRGINEWDDPINHDDGINILFFDGHVGFSGALTQYQVSTGRTVPVRHYAHEHPVGKNAERSDFQETLFWNPLLITDSKGEATINFDLSDSVTTYRVLVDAHSREGQIGTGESALISRIPFYVEPKVPLELTAEDRLLLPLAIVNDTESEFEVNLQPQHSENLLLDEDEGQGRPIKLMAGSRARVYFPMRATSGLAEARIAFRAQSGSLIDHVERKITVVPGGFPIEESRSGWLEGEEKISFNLPEKILPGTLRATLKLFPSTVATLQEGMESLLRQPHGCFEQASSTNYPNVLVMRYLKEHRVSDPALMRRCRELLNQGYVKLTGYECKSKGYEWFGADPGHEALTAYGLMEFRDMAEVFNVDASMLERTRTWLLERRDGQGGFQRNTKSIGSFGHAPQDLTDAYIVWALTESGERQLGPELEALQKKATGSKDAYFIALVANALLNVEQKEYRSLLECLATAQCSDGHLDGQNVSITGSTGRNLQIETTALAALAWLRPPKYTLNAKRAIDWLIRQRSGGLFGATQATVLAMKAFLAHAKANHQTTRDGEVLLYQGQQLLKRNAFKACHTGTFEFANLESGFLPGENSIRLELIGGNAVPYSLALSYRSPKPASSEVCPVQLTTRLERNEVGCGDALRLSARVRNTAETAQAMTVAILGIPAGCEVRADSLKELRDSGRIDFFETRAREVIFYWRGLRPRQEVEIPLDLIAAIPGIFTAPASRAYLYYNDDHKTWVDPVHIEIAR